MNDIFAKFSNFVSPELFGKLFRALIILLIAFIASKILKRTLKFFFRRLQARISLPGFKEKTETLRSLLKSVITVTIVLITLITILVEFGINIGPILAGAGVIGFAIGFGSQTLVKDFLSGTFMILEDQFNVGDQIEVLGITGTVKKISLRTIILQDIEGNFHYITNSQITRVKRFAKK